MGSDVVSKMFRDFILTFASWIDNTFENDIDIETYKYFYLDFYK